MDKVNKPVYLITLKTEVKQALLTHSLKQFNTLYNITFVNYYIAQIFQAGRVVVALILRACPPPHPDTTICTGNVHNVHLFEYMLQ